MTTNSTSLRLDRKLSHSSMNCWRTCRAQYHFKYLLDYDPPPTIGLIRGKVCHSAMGSWYTDYDEDKAIEIASNEFMQYEELLGETYDKDWELTELVLRRYCNWSLENDNFDKTLGIEERFDFVEQRFGDFSKVERAEIELIVERRYELPNSFECFFRACRHGLPWIGWLV